VYIRCERLSTSDTNRCVVLAGDDKFFRPVSFAFSRKTASLGQVEVESRGKVRCEASCHFTFPATAFFWCLVRWYALCGTAYLFPQGDLFIPKTSRIRALRAGNAASPNWKRASATSVTASAPMPLTPARGPRPFRCRPQARRREAHRHNPRGQTGHPPHVHRRLPAKRLHKVVPFVPTQCSRCPDALPSNPGPDGPEPTLHPTAELLQMAARITEY
jgi:hypothetical protein